jgi:TonB family protein
MSSSTSGPLRLAEEYLVRGDVKEALGIYQRISETEPSNLTIKSRLGELCVLANHNSDAVRVLADVARGHSREGHQAEAVATLQKVLRLGPSDPDTLMDIGGLCGRAGLSADAERCYIEAADLYAGNGDTAKLEAAYESAAAVAPANADVLMKLGAVCHRSGRLADSYRAFMKAAAEFNRRGDDSSALDAYGKALKVAPTGAEAGNAVAEVMKHLGLAENASAGSRSRTPDRPAAPLTFPHPIAAVESGAALSRGDAGRAAKPDATDDELLVGRISKAELLFGFGRSEQAITLLEELADMKPNDPRVHRKLKDIYLRSEMPEKAGAVYRELARIYKAEGDDELAADCMASARRLCGLPAEPQLEGPAAGRSAPPNVVWRPVGETKEPDLTLITPALPPNPQVSRYLPSRQRTEPVGEASRGERPETIPSSATDQTDDNQPPKIVLSTPPISQVRMSTPPLHIEPRQPEKALEGQPEEAAAETAVSPAALLEPAGTGLASAGTSISRPAPASERAAVSLPATALPAPSTPPQTVANQAPGLIAAIPAPPIQNRQPAAPSSTTAPVLPRPKPASPASSASTLFGVPLDPSTDTKTDKPAKGRYRIAVAVAALVLSGSAGGYFLVRRNQARDNIAAATTETQPAPVQAEPTASPVPLEVNAAPEAEATTAAEKPDTSAANQAKKTPDPAAQREQQSQAASPTPIPYVAATAQPTLQPRPTPPPMVGPVGAAPGNSGAPSVAPGGLARDLPAAPPPPTPGPTVRHAAVMGGGEVVRRVEPVYPQAARSAHITGTVTVELSINEQGSVVSARATSGPGMLAGAAESAARGFKFKPTTLDGVPVKSNRTVLFHFKE